MGAIAGILYLDGRHAQESEIGLMVAAMAHRGPDGMHTWHSGQVGLGHCMLYTTPESLTERLPLSSEDGRYSITADARIDNREELATALGLDGPRSRAMADGEYILAAYVKWGDRCAEKLIGDFAFAIWDSDQRRLFCARDPMGVRCLYYHHSPSAFAFATEIKGILALLWVPRRLDELRVAEFLVGYMDDRARTSYADVSALPAAHWLSVSEEGLRHGRHWELDSESELHLRSDDEYVEVFRQTFAEAVKCRLRSAYPVGSMLSGGLDSSSIVCVARAALLEGHGPPLHTFSALFTGLPEAERRLCDERPCIEAVLAQGSLHPHYVHADRLSPFGQIELMLRRCDDVQIGFNSYISWALYEAAQEANVRVMMDGMDGDSTISYGQHHLLDCFTGLRWARLLGHLKLYGRRFGVSRRLALANAVIEPLLSYRLGPFWDTLTRAQPWVHSSAINREFAIRVGLPSLYEERQRDIEGWLPTSRRLHCLGIGSSIHQAVLQLVDQQSSPFCVEPRYPFYDRRLIDLCVSLPSAQKLHEGWTRSILRRGMAGILPDRVRLRLGKADLGRNLRLKLATVDAPLVDRMFDDIASIGAFVDVTELKAAFARYAADPAGAPAIDVMSVMRAIMLYDWLRLRGIST